MARPRRMFSRLDWAIVVASVPLGVGLALATDREYMQGHGATPAYSGSTTRLPVWLKERRHDAIRVLNGSAAFLAVLGTGLAMGTLRPRPGGSRRRLGPGHIAAVLTALLVVAFLGRLLGGQWNGPVTPRGLVDFVGSVELYTVWYLLRPQMSWAVLGAWFVLLLTGRWRGPVDLADRLGLWLGRGWIGLVFVQGIVFVLAWT